MQVSQKEALQVPFQLEEAQTPQEVEVALARPQEEVVAVLLERETRQGAREGAAEEGAAAHPVQDSQRWVRGSRDGFHSTDATNLNVRIMYFFFLLLSRSVQHHSVGGTSGQKSNATRPD